FYFQYSTLAGCSAVDIFSQRLMDVSDGLNTADVQSVTLNIVRAGRSEPTTFVALNQYTANRNADLRIGLPTITFGTGQTAAQKQFVFGGNVIDNSAGYGLGLTQLRTKGFVDAFMTSVPVSELGAFIDQDISHEFLFLLFIELIRVKAGNETFELRNDPTLDNTSSCPDYDYSSYHDRTSRPEEQISIYQPAELKGLLEKCEFHRFQFFIEEAIRYGVSVARVSHPSTPPGPEKVAAKSAAKPPPVSPPSTAVSTQPDQPQKQTPGDGLAVQDYRFCFDVAKANKNVPRYL